MQTLCKFWSNEERVERSKIRTFFLSKTFVKKEKWSSAQTCNSYVFSTKHSAAPQPKGYKR